MRLFSPQPSASAESDLQKATAWQENCDLVLVPTERSDRPVSKVQSILALVGNLWQKSIAALTKQPELEIRQKQDRYGRIHWHVYDPHMSKSVSFASELEMLRWLDSRYGRW
jgi:hypothetical protein